MNWKDFFSLNVYLGEKSSEPFFRVRLKVPEQIPVHELMISRFEDLGLSPLEKKRLSMDLRKILVCHHYFRSPEFYRHAEKLRRKIQTLSGDSHTLHTEGGGVYLILALFQHDGFVQKKIVCHTPELPLPILPALGSKARLQLIFRPEQKTYLADFPSLWKKSDLLGLFETCPRKSRVA